MIAVHYRNIKFCGQKISLSYLHVFDKFEVYIALGLISPFLMSRTGTEHEKKKWTPHDSLYLLFKGEKRVPQSSVSNNIKLKHKKKVHEKLICFLKFFSQFLLFWHIPRTSQVWQTSHFFFSVPVLQQGYCKQLKVSSILKHGCLFLRFY